MSLSKRKIQISIIVIVGVLLRLLCIPFFQGVDADATTRVLIAERLIDSPEFITHGIWLPLHHYLNVFAILMTGEHVYGPVVINILLASFIAIPIFQFTEREISLKGAWFAATLLVLSPVFFRNSFHALSGVPYAFLIAWSLNWLSLSLKLNNTKYAILSGLMITLAAGMRYEAWLVIALFTAIYFLKKKWTLMSVFWLVAMVFPAFWMIGNFIENGDLFSGLTGAYDWNIGMEGVNDSVTAVEKLKRFIYFPFSWFFLMSPLVLFPMLFMIWKKFRVKKLPLDKLIWLIPFLVVFIIFIKKSYDGTLLNQHRFTQSLVLFSIPFTALVADYLMKIKGGRVYLYACVALLLPLSYVWMKIPYEKAFGFSYSLRTGVKEIRLASTNSFTALPRLENQVVKQMTDEINANLNANAGCVLDFESWENTFYIAAHAKVPNERLFVLDGAKNGGVYASDLIRVLISTKQGVLLLNKASKFSETYEVSGNQLRFLFDKSFSLELKRINSFEGIDLFKYTYVQESYVEGEPAIFKPFASSSLEYAKLKIKQNNFWFADIKYKAKLNNTSIEAELEKAALEQINIAQ